jgi:lipopolysaccharide/colanic/teichoic acid biosynthesis glycosyltransferase
MNAKRIFDLLLAIMGILILSPVFLSIAVILKLGSRGPVYYKQLRVGMNGKGFILYKFRTMYLDSDRSGLLTVGDHDCRITKAGYLLRKYKLDELPQLLNILIGDMSFVGPRPEVQKYVDLYNDNQRRVLDVKPGITDWASINYVHESELLAAADDPEMFYINTIIPTKIEQNLKYIDHHSLWIDLRIISNTIRCVFWHV